MSAFICENTTLDRIISALQFRRNEYARRPIEALGFDVMNGREGKQALGEALRALNVLALKQRYPDDTDDSRPGKTGELTVQSYEYKSEHHISDVQGYKSLECLLYQCSEGNAPNMPLFKALVQVGDQMAAGIVSRLDAYETANWG